MDPIILDVLQYTADLHFVDVVVEGVNQLWIVLEGKSLVIIQLVTKVQNQKAMIG